MHPLTFSFLLAAAAATTAIQDPAKPQEPQKPRETTAVKATNVVWVDHPFVKGGKMSVQSGDPAKGPSVLMMRFPKGMTIQPHWHTSDEIVTVVAGTALFGSGETVDATKATELTPGGYAVIPGPNPHWAIVKEDLTITVTLNKPADFHLCGDHKAK